MRQSCVESNSLPHLQYVLFLRCSSYSSWELKTGPQSHFILTHSRLTIFFQLKIFRADMLSSIKIKSFTFIIWLPNYMYGISTAKTCTHPAFTRLHRTHHNTT